MTPFDKFLSGLRADCRLGRYLPAETIFQTPETVILSLVISLANATEGRALHPAFKLLDEMDRPAPRPLRPPLAAGERVAMSGAE